MSRIDWGKPGWIMTAMWVFAALAMLAFSIVWGAIMCFLIAVFRGAVTYYEP